MTCLIGSTMLDQISLLIASHPGCIDSAEHGSCTQTALLALIRCCCPTSPLAAQLNCAKPQAPLSSPPYIKAVSSGIRQGCRL